MSSIVQAPRRVTGSPVRQAADFAIGGALVPLSYPLLPWVAGYGFDLQVYGPIAAVGAVVGGAVGAVSPILLERFRRGVPLWLLATLATVTSTAAMLVTWWAAGQLDHSVLTLVLSLGAVVGAVFWLPYTVATVTGRPTWPLVLAVPALTSLAPVVELLFIWLG